MARIKSRIVVTYDLDFTMDNLHPSVLAMTEAGRKAAFKKCVEEEARGGHWRYSRGERQDWR